MKAAIPFLKPKLPEAESYLPLLKQIDSSRLYSNYGPLCSSFEARVLAEAYAGQGGVCTVNNATIGLMLALRQARRRGSVALMPSFTFAATPLAAEWAGLEPYFVDVDPESWCMDEGRLRAALDEVGDAAAVVVPYAAFGTSMDLSYYEELHRGGLPVVVDAASSFGTRRGSTWFGAGFPGYVVFSFHATKAFAVGEGGVVYSADADAMTRFRRAGNFGFGPDRASDDCGLNSKISEYVAAVAHVAWERFPEVSARRFAIFNRYIDGLMERDLIAKGWAPQRLEGHVPCQFMPLLCPPIMDAKHVVLHLAANGIECRTYFSPACHEQPHFADTRHGPLDVTIDVAGRILSLPVWVDMPDELPDRILDCLCEL